MLFRVIIDASFQNHMKSINTFCRENEFLDENDNVL
jgi:hypothetical protein